MRVSIRGRTFETVKEAAEWAGVSKRTIYSALARNRIDMVGTGAGRTGAARMKYGKSGKEGGVGRRRGLELWGRKFETIRDAEEWLGVRKGYLQQVIKRIEKGRGGGVGGEAWARVMALAQRRVELGPDETGVGPRVKWKGGRTAVPVK